MARNAIGNHFDVETTEQAREIIRNYGVTLRTVNGAIRLSLPDSGVVTYAASWNEAINVARDMAFADSLAFGYHILDMEN